MKINILITSSSFIDNEGPHKKFYSDPRFNITEVPGPNSESKMLELIKNIDGMICGDDFISKQVILKGSRNRLKVISKYGTGLDKIDLESAKLNNVVVKNCYGINHETVSEHFFALLLSHYKNIINSSVTNNNLWSRKTGKDLKNKKLGVLGVGNIGKEIIKRAISFNIQCKGFDKNPDTDFESKHDFLYSDLNEILIESDIIALCLSLDDNSKNIINSQTLAQMKKNVTIVNVSRGELVNEDSICEFLLNNSSASYLTDVLSVEPISNNHKFLSLKNVFITPHIGSRTSENVNNQADKAVKNLLENLNI